MKIADSVQALLNSRDQVVRGFYDRFLDRHAELRHHFEQRDLELQASIVTMALVSVEAYYSHRFPATEHYLKVLGHRHYHNGIRREDFPKFRDVLLETLRDFHGEQWSDELAQEWFDAINLAVDVMLEGYSKRFTY